MKTVFNNAMVCHVWAQRRQEHGRNASGSLHFVGPVLWSYQTPIANIVQPYPPSKPAVLLVSSNPYSIATGKQINDARRAQRGNIRQIFHVAFVTDRAAGWQHGPAKSQDWHAENLAAMVADYQKMRDRLKRSQSWYFASQVEVRTYLETETNELRDYADVFGLPSPALPIDDDAAFIWARIERLNAERAKPEYAEKRAKAAAGREAAAERKRVRDIEARAKREADQRQAWLNGDRLPYGGRPSCAQGGAMLRIDEPHQRIVTSWGAEAPLDDVRRVLRFYRLIVRDLAMGRETQWHRATDRDSAHVTLGHFSLDRINADGSVRVGCHVIYAPEIERIADILLGPVAKVQS